MMEYPDMPLQKPLDIVCIECNGSFKRKRLGNCVFFHIPKTDDR